jgi:hypothetical protein
MHDPLLEIPHQSNPHHRGGRHVRMDAMDLRSPKALGLVVHLHLKQLADEVSEYRLSAMSAFGGNVLQNSANERFKHDYD